jgi:hypothetical protein
MASAVYIDLEPLNGIASYTHAMGFQAIQDSQKRNKTGKRGDSRTASISPVRTKVGFASEVINHPPIVEQTDFEEFKREVEREWLSGSAISPS